MRLASKTSRTIALGRRPTAALWLVAGVLGLGSCTQCGQDAPENPPTSARDAGGSAGGNEAGSTTSQQSSSGAAGGPAFPGWSPLAGVPAYCEVYAIDDPSSVPPLVWMACADGTPGCRELEISWMPSPATEPFYPVFAGGVTEAGPVLVQSRRSSGSVPDWSDMVMAYVDGPVLAVLRSMDPVNTKEPCITGSAAVGAGRIVAGVVDWTAYPATVEHELQVLLDGGAPTVFNTLNVDVLHSNVIDVQSPGSAFVGLSFQPGSTILSVPYDGGAPTLVAKYTPQNPLGLSDPIAVGTDLLFWAVHDDRAREHIYHAATGVSEPLLDVAGVDVFGARTDGKTLVWLQSSPPKSVSATPTSAELWSSPYATSAQGLAPQKIADLSPAVATPYTLFESGLVVLFGLDVGVASTSWSRKIVVRLSDKTFWTVDAPLGLWWGATIYATADEIAMPVQPPWKQSETFTIRRQKLADLGPPKPIVGLLGGP